MKEYIIKEKRPGKYEYGYKLQKLDIKTMMQLGLPVPNKLKEIYGNGFNYIELKDYIYFQEPEMVEFISRQYWIRDIVEFANMNLYELDLLLSTIQQDVINLEKKLDLEINEDEKIYLFTKLKELKNEYLGLMYLRDNLTRLNLKEDKKVRK